MEGLLHSLEGRNRRKQRTAVKNRIWSGVKAMKVPCTQSSSMAATMSSGRFTESKWSCCTSRRAYTGTF